MIGCFNRSVILTYIGVLFSLYGMFLLAMYGAPKIPLICLILAGVCDLFDGALARKFKRNETQKQFGVQIDSLADTVSFLILPAMLLFFLEHIAAFIVGGFYVICGIYRLAWFNIKAGGFKNVYSGLPVTYAALVLPIFYLIVRFVGHSVIIMPMVYALLGVLFILNIKVPKPRPAAYPFFALLAVALIVIIILFY